MFQNCACFEVWKPQGRGYTRKKKANFIRSGIPLINQKKGKSHIVKFAFRDSSRKENPFQFHARKAKVHFMWNLAVI